MKRQSLNEQKEGVKYSVYNILELFHTIELFITSHHSRFLMPHVEVKFHMQQVQ